MSTCPICKTPINRNKLMCGAHWFLVPTKNKTEVNAAFNTFTRNKTINSLTVLRAAQEKAITEVRIKGGGS